MNSRKQHKSICFILILSMLFLGMCFENIEADSSLAYQLVSQADSTLRSSQNTSLSRQIYMEESIGRPVAVSYTHLYGEGQHGSTDSEGGRSSCDI